MIKTSQRIEMFRCFREFKYPSNERSFIIILIYVMVKQEDVSKRVSVFKREVTVNHNRFFL